MTPARALAYARCVEMLNSIAELIKVLVAKISSIFDVFDVSFFVSGGTCMLAFAYLRHIYGPGALPYPDGALAIAIAILGSYVLGLLCFATGRWLRRSVFGRYWQVDFDKRLRDALQAHGLDGDASVALYIGRSAKARDIYPRLWAELRQEDALKASFDLLRSYWVRAAVYDGLICVLVIWGLAVGLAMREASGLRHAPGIGAGILSFLGIGLAACSREAARSDEYQIDEIVASLAYARDKRAAAEAAALKAAEAAAQKAAVPVREADAVAPRTTAAKAAAVAPIPKPTGADATKEAVRTTATAAPGEAVLPAETAEAIAAAEIDDITAAPSIKGDTGRDA